MIDPGEDVVRVRIGMTRTQAALLADRRGGDEAKPYHTIAVVGGYGSGKSRGIDAKVIDLARMNAGVPVLYCMPTIDMLRDVAIPGVLGLLDDYGFLDGEDFHYRKRDREIRIHFSEGTGIIRFRPTTDPRRIVGANIAAAVVDECEDNPEDSINQIKRRLRHPKAKCRQLVLCGTPESMGGLFYRECEGAPDADTHVIRMSSVDNVFVDASYARNLLSSLSEEERDLYVHGKFVARRGRIYTHLDEDSCFRDLSRAALSGEYVMGCDFGKGVMSWVFGVVVDEMLYIIGEYAKEQVDTHTASRDVRRWWKEYFAAQGLEFDEHAAASQVTAYCDPAGQNGSASDVRILQDVGFNARWHKTHPRIRDRINAVQERLMRNLIAIDDELAPYLSRCLRGQCYDRHGKPEKGRPREGLRGLDHANDALGYLVEFRWPSAVSGIQIN